METTKHTPGPWGYTPNTYNNTLAEIKIPGTSHTQVFRTSDACLIAAAPEQHEELLTELIYLWQIKNDLMGADVPDFAKRIPIIKTIEVRVDAIHAAIAKATGGQS